ncbi:LOW QUALITY PROTEIN: hypothetical protein CVT25_003950 [Psilocybe cyanescens]|uniref:FACT complex subunit POB3 n=1 Tax=Psilocybe cyanescens TaxID=93625 RepID=A0A409VXA7_PSICY|nr:LOW QUALITY PROTEIN: hypothetical protein CVT25_003950 [Psilocybe cyanescens]
MACLCVPSFFVLADCGHRMVSHRIGSRQARADAAEPLWRQSRDDRDVVQRVELGVADFDLHGEELAFRVSDKTAFELPLRHVANSNTASKTEVSLEFSNLTPAASDFNPTQKSKQLGDEPTEIRFFVPGTITKLKGSDKSDAEDNANVNVHSDNDDDDEEISTASSTTPSKSTRPSARTRTTSSSRPTRSSCSRRGGATTWACFLIAGEDVCYKVLYQSMARLFLLQKDDQQVLFILGLSTPIRQGQTLSQYLVMQFTREKEITAELNMSEEDLAKYDGKLKKNYEDPTYVIVSSVFRALAGKKIIGSASFQSRDGHPGLKANLKAIQGDLFMLECYSFFFSKQPLLIELADIQQVTFSRVGSSAAASTAGRTFDIKTTTKAGGPEYLFTSINKEHEVTEVYLRDADFLMKAVVDDEDDEDEDMQSEDFQASDSDSSDGSGAQTASDASGDMMLAGKPKNKTKSKSKTTPAAAKGKSKAADDASEGGTPKKVVKKKAAAAPAKADANGSDAEDDDKRKRKRNRPKPKPKAATATTAAKKEDGDEPMDVNGEEKPKPKAAAPKPKPKASGFWLCGWGTAMR